MKSFVVLAFVILFGTLKCNGIPPLDPEKILHIPLSCGGMTRILIQGDTIKDAIIYPESYAGKATLHKSGQLFLDSKSLPVSLQITLITEGGVTQDLEFSCGDAAPGPIILKHPERPIQTYPIHEDQHSHQLDPLNTTLPSTFNQQGEKND